MKVEITKAQLQAIIDMAEEEKAMLGVGDDDSRHIKRLRLIGRFLEKNGYENIYK